MSAVAKSLADTISLKSGAAMPVLGLGVYQSPRDTIMRTIATAFDAGYRHIDGAQYYANEAEMGAAVRATKVPRSEVFVTTKMYARGSVGQCYRSAADSVAKINLDGYVDLFLVHGPPFSLDGRKNIWQALEKLHKEGKARSIGVSNYEPDHLAEMDSYATVPPVCNQIELHPFCQNKAIVDECHNRDIPLQAYCPLVRGHKNNDATVKGIAQKLEKDPGQILVRWSLQKGYIPLPKSDNPGRIVSNADVFNFELSKEDMAALDSLDCGLQVAA